MAMVELNYSTPRYSTPRVPLDLPMSSWLMVRFQSNFYLSVPRKCVEEEDLTLTAPVAAMMGAGEQQGMNGQAFEAGIAHWCIARAGPKESIVGTPPVLQPADVASYCMIFMGR